MPVKVEMLYYKGCFEYYGISDFFDEVAEGGIISEYKLIFHETNVEFKKVEVRKIEQ